MAKKTKQSSFSPLSLQTLTTGYHKKEISKSISAELCEATVTALIGTNGCGKSTLLNAIAFGDTVLEGNIAISGVNTTTLTPYNRSKLVSYVQSQINPELAITVEELVAMGRIPYINAIGTLKQHDKEIIHRAILSCKLKGFEKRKVNSLSDGERQRALIAMALAQQTPLVLLDEPTSHLDLNFRIELFILLREIAQLHRTSFLLATHEINLAMQWCDAFWLLNSRGELICGVPEELALQGIIDELFTTSRFSYNALSGKINVLQQARRGINVTRIEGTSCETYEWTLRLLNRIGYENIPTAGLSLVVYPNFWQIASGKTVITATSLAELQQLLYPNLNTFA